VRLVRLGICRDRSADVLARGLDIAIVQFLDASFAELKSAPFASAGLVAFNPNQRSLARKRLLCADLSMD
jgi:hypothetical protein